LDFLRERDPEVARALHGPGEKPFTLSLVQGGRRRRSGVLAFDREEACWLRVTCLAPGLSPLLLAWLQEDPGNVRFGPVTFTRLETVFDPSGHPQAGWTDLASLWERWREEKRPPGRIALRFDSPTAFRSGNTLIPFPLPGLVFSRLAARWNRWSGRPLDRELMERLCGSVRVAGHRLRTERLRFDRYWMTGFTGWCAFDAGRDLELRRLAHLLADYVFYSGVGYKTPMGMGQAAPREMKVRTRSDLGH